MRKLAVIGAALALAACATITRGTTQVVTVDTPGVVGAECTISTPSGPQVVVTPGNVTLNKGSASLPVRCTKACYNDGAGIIATSVEPMAAGNVLVGGVVGIGVDAATGAMNKYVDQVTIAMVPVAGCRPPGAAPVARKR